MNNQQDIQREEVHSIIQNGFEFKLGDRLSCLCQFDIIQIYPIWDSRTGEHLKDHYGNSFAYQLQTSSQCPIHWGGGYMP
jgi:hypothetical protein